MRARLAQAALLLCCAAPGFALDAPTDTQPVAASTETQSGIASPAMEGKQRIAGVLPNNNTVDGSLPFARISSLQKLDIARKDSFDPPVFYLSAIFAGFSQLSNGNAEFGQGLRGYGKRYAASLADRAMGNFFTEGIYPTLFHQDPRYFRKESGGGRQRVGYALSRVFVAKNDHGNLTFNAAEWAGNGTAVAISNLYYFGDHSRTATNNLQRLGIQVAQDAGGNLLREFWPDIRRKVFRKK